MRIYSVISPSWCAWILAFLSLVPRLSQHKAMFTYFKQSQTSQYQTIPYHFSQSIIHPSPNSHLSFVNHDSLCMLQRYNGHHGSSIFFLLFQIGGCLIQVILYKISTTGTWSSGHNKKEVAVWSVLSENAAYQLISSRICQRRRYTFYKEFECSQVTLQYMPILNSHCHCSLRPGLAMNDAHRNGQKVIRVE